MDRDRRTDFLARAKAYARRHPEDRHQAALVASLDPSWTPPVVIPPGRTLDLTAVRAERAALTLAPPSPAAVSASANLAEATAADRPALTLAPPSPASATSGNLPEVGPVSRPRTLDVGAVRRRQAAEAAARRPPSPPPSALRFVASNSWRWCLVDSALPGARSWTRLVSDLVAAGPLLSLDVRRGQCDGDGGHARFHHGDGGAVWASVVIDPAVCGSPHRTERVLAHELAHVGDELARLQTVTAAAWWRDFRDPHREAQAEAFAVAAEDWLRPDTTAEALIASARAHQADRRVR